MRRPRGFSMAEMLVVFVLMSAVSTVIVLVFNQSKTAFEMGTGRVAGGAKSREALLKISPLLASAFGANLGGQDAIYSPSIVSGVGAANVVFSSTEDFLYNNATFRYDPLDNSPAMQGISSIYMPTTFSGTFNHFTYQLRFVNSTQDPQVTAFWANPDYRYRRADGTLAPVVPGDMLLEYGVFNPVGPTFTRLNDSAHTTENNPRHLVRSTRDAAIVGATFRRIYDASQIVELRMDLVSPARTASRQIRIVQQTTYGAINVGAESLR